MAPANGNDGTSGNGATATPEQRAQAAAFGDRVDELLREEPRPPAMPADERALLEIATAIRASAGDQAELAPPRADALIDAALAAAAGPPRADTVPLPADGEIAPAKPRFRHMTPWLVAVASAAAAAAAATLALRPGPAPSPAPTARTDPPAAQVTRSRPTDELVGRIAASEAHLASARIDTIFDDRMRGFRSLQLTRAGVQ